MNKYFRIYYLAQRWALSEEGEEWIEKYVPSMKNYMDKEYNKINNAVYIIKFNDIYVYCGESIKAINRLCVHLYNIYSNSYDYFGITKDEIHDNKVKISVYILEDSICKKQCRKQKELKYIDKYKPILQTLKVGSDRCIRKNRRRQKIVECVFN